jgi:CubicO group peptidase (beta-lactamase class C family)
MLRSYLSFCLLAFSFSAAVAQPPEIPDDEKPLRAFLNCTATAERFAFVGEHVPDVKLSQPDAAQAYLGDYATQVQRFNAQLEPMDETAEHVGPVYALLTIKPKQGRTTYRTATLYRLAEQLPDAKFTSEVLPAMAKAAALDPAVVAAQETQLRKAIGDRTLRAAAGDPQLAVLLAGMSALKEPPTRRNADAIAQERTQWVRLKQKLFCEGEKQTVGLQRPTKVVGLAAPIVREGTPEEAGVKPDTSAKIDAALNAWAADTDEAFAVCVVRRGVIVHHKAYGTRDGQPMTLTTKSWMASVTKSMSATLAMMHVDQGLLDLDAPVGKYLPLWGELQPPSPLTLRHLYTHTNGLERWPGFADERADVEFLVADLHPKLQVGKVWGYNGLGYTLGGKIMERLNGRSMPELYLTHLLGPLGMEHTDVVGTHADAFSVPLDIAKFGQMLLNRGAYGDLQFMRPETFDKMLPQKLTITLGPEATKTFGIGLDGQPGTGRFGHGAASAATFSVNANDELAVIMTRNKIGTHYDKYNGKFWEAIEQGIVR